jgi:drug/metabolite transporter (DMT)-like permease
VPMSLLILVSAVLAYLTGIIAVRRLGGAVASFVALTEVLFAVVFAAVLLGQVPTGGQVVGGLLVLAGIVVVQGGSASAPPWALGRVLYRRLRSTMRR